MSIVGHDYETNLTAWFGADEGLAHRLRFPVFLSTLTGDAVAALKKTYKQLPKRITTYLEEHDAALPDDVASDHRYDFRVLLIPMTGPKSEADAAMRFVHADDLTPDERDALDQVQTIVRDKQVPVSGKGKLKPSQVCARVEGALGIRLTPSSDHARAWQYYAVRPPTGAAKPELTEQKYCVYDEPHGDYVYTDAWVSLLVEELADPDRFETVIGKPPIQLRAPGPPS